MISLVSGEVELLVDVVFSRGHWPSMAHLWIIHDGFTFKDWINMLIFQSKP